MNFKPLELIKYRIVMKYHWGIQAPGGVKQNSARLANPRPKEQSDFGGV